MADAPAAEAPAAAAPAAEAPATEAPAAQPPPATERRRNEGRPGSQAEDEGEEEGEEEEEDIDVDLLIEEEEPEIRKNLNTFGIPNDEKLLTAYNIYKPSPETLAIKSERYRKYYSEEFIENINLGTLSDLCVRVLAKAYGPFDIPYIIRCDPLKMRIFYDSIDVELPLEKCYFIEDELFWKRCVLTKSKDETTNLDKKYKWKNLAISMKYIELVEAASAEYWPEEEMVTLAKTIKEFVTHMHIRTLKPLPDSAFEKYFEETPPPSEQEEVEEKFENSTDITTPSSSWLSYEGSSSERSVERTSQELAEKVALKEQRKIGKQQKRLAKEEQIVRRAAREERRLAREAELLKPKKKKKRKKQITGVFDIELEPDSEEEDNESEEADNRNIEKLVKRRRRFKYPPEYCHHVDLSFLGSFENLVELLIEFKPPEMKRDYKTRHFNFSYEDIDNLTYGLTLLKKLKIFRLRNSRMDATKVQILARVLSRLLTLEIIDLGFDTLKDDCGFPLMQLFGGTTSIKHLELEGNYIGYKTLSCLGEAMQEYEGKLEYLGLARNTMGASALHAFVRGILGTEHIKHLNLTAAMLDEDDFICCVANELLKEHPPLEQLDLLAIPMTNKAGTEIMKTLISNLTIQYMDVRACSLDYELERDVEICLKRNRYIRANPYIGDVNATKEEIEAFVGRTKNPILLDVLEQLKNREECLESRPSETQRWTIIPEEEKVEPEEEERKESVFSLSKYIEMYTQKTNGSVVKEKDEVVEKVVEPPRFVYDANNFTAEQILRHVNLPGPGERYYYMIRFDPTTDASVFDDALNI